MMISQNANPKGFRKSEPFFLIKKQKSEILKLDIASQ